MDLRFPYVVFFVFGFTVSSHVIRVVQAGIEVLILLWADDGSALSLTRPDSYVHLSEAVHHTIPDFSYYVS